MSHGLGYCAPSAGDAPPFHIGILLYPECDLLDVAGPNEVFSFLDGSLFGRKVEVTSVAETTAQMKALGAVSITAQHDFHSCPPLDLLFVPGAGGGVVDALKNENLLKSLRDAAAPARYVASVCTGSLLLAAAGLLDGYAATTHWSVIDCLKLFPEVKVANGCPRYVHDGNRITGGGISSSIDESLAIVEIIVSDLSGDPRKAAAATQAIQLSIQYHPQPPHAGGDPCAVDYAVYAPVAASMQPFKQAVCAAVGERLGLHC